MEAVLAAFFDQRLLKWASDARLFAVRQDHPARYVVLQ
jgi:hypothetical protein